ncbi:MAG: DUF4838 domain-containing protein [Kiritimatiellaeota bacterium]|nr:DUF4838 domain-containing protein [Kiritimatiellota bacterium]
MFPRIPSFLAVCAALCFISNAASGFDLVRAGQPVAIIVLPDTPLPCVKAAADELIHHVKKASGAVLNVVTEKQAPKTGPMLFLGATKAAQAAGLDVPSVTPNAFRIKLIGDRLFLLGDDSDGPAFWILHGNRTRVGTLFAVYEFLERRLRVRWIWPGETGEIVPRQRTISVERWDQMGRPAMAHTRWRDGPAAGVEGWADPAHRSRFIQDQSKWLRRHRFALGINLDVRHSFTYYWKKYGKSHPEYFNLLPDGTRRSDPLYHGGAAQLVAMCPSNPDLVREVVERFRKSPMNPGRLYVDASENDTPGKCVCAQCLAMDVPAPDNPVPFKGRLEACRKAFAAKDPDWWKALGSMTDRYCRFWLAVQKEARKHDPNAVVLFHGYANYVRPPLKTRLNRNMMNSFVPGFLFPWTDEAVRRFQSDWLGWVKAGCRMMLRPNYLDCGHNFPIFYARKFAEQFNFAWTYGMMATDYDAIPGQYATQGLNHYVVARLNERPGTPAQEVFREFFDAFGPARQAVARYFGIWERLSDRLTPKQLEAAGEPNGLKGVGSALYADFYMLAPRIFTAEVMHAARAELDVAQKLAAADPDASARVEVLVAGFRDVELTLAAQVAYETYRKTGDLDPFGKALADLDAHRRTIEPLGLINMYWLRKWELRHWDRTLVRLMTANPGTRLADPWRFAWDPRNEGEKRRWQAPAFDDSQWQKVRTEGPWEDQPIGKAWADAHGGRGYDGLAWYRTRFSVPPADRGKRISLLFGAVDEACTIWLNGKRILDRPYPFRGNKDSWQQAFEVDISKTVRFERPNALAVRVRDDAGAGGIWKPVWLLTAKPDADAARNIVRNGGFEEGDRDWKRHVVAGKFEFAVDRSGAARSGRACATLRCLELAPKDLQRRLRLQAWARWYQPLTLEKDRRYRLRLWVKTDPAFAGRIVVFFTGDKEKKTRSGRLIGTRGIWRKLTVDGYRATGDNAGVYLNVMDGVGRVWFDDVQVVPVAP